MKKIISLLLCLVFATLSLAGCGKDRIGEDLDDSMKGYEKERLTLNFYIVGDTTNDNATVNARINNYTTKQFNTSLNIVYCNESDYEQTVIDALDAAKTAIDSEATDEASLNAIKNKPDFFLINSAEMMQTLYEKGHLADLTEFFYPEIYESKVEIYKELKEKPTHKFHLELIKKCEGLHNQIAKSLMDASIIYETTYDEQTKKDVTNEKNYCVPNNRLIGSYTYLVIDKAAAREVYMGSDSKLSSFTPTNYGALVTAISEAKGISVDAVKATYVRTIEGKYEDKAMYEANGFACNIVEYPQVAGIEAADSDANIPANVDNVFNSAFAVGAYPDEYSVTDRAMEIIYALNTDNILHNYLQYGVQDTNYTIDAETGFVDYEQITNADNKYFMNPIYTGDMFKLLPNASWTEADMTNAKNQNDQSVVYKNKK